MRIEFDRKLSERVFFGDGFSFMVLGRQPNDPNNVYFISVKSEGIPGPLVPIVGSVLQDEIDAALPRGVFKGIINQELLSAQLDSYYAHVPQGGSAFFTCGIKRIIEIMSIAKGACPMAAIPVRSQ